MGLGCPEDTCQEYGCRFPVAMIHLLNDSPFTLYIILLDSSYIGYSKEKHRWQIDGLVQDCGNSSALAVELPQSCTKPLIWGWTFCQWFINLLLWSQSFRVSVCATAIKPLSAHEMGTQSLVDTACCDYMETTCKLMSRLQPTNACWQEELHQSHVAFQVEDLPKYHIFNHWTIVLNPCTTKLLGVVVYWFHSVRPSVMHPVSAL